MTANKTSSEEQYRLVVECRQSGKTDYQWCTEHGINPGTFYNWVRRLKKKACCEIPASAAKELTARASNVQDVVKVDILPDFTKETEHAETQYSSESFVPAAEINWNGICIRLSNDAGAALISNISRLIGGGL